MNLNVTIRGTDPFPPKSNIFPFAAHAACFNSGQRVEDHFVEVTDMIEREAPRPKKPLTVSRYARYLIAGLNAQFAESHTLEIALSSNLERLGHAH